MKVINFSHNWNGKLNSEKYFTTIRKESDYYQVGDKFLINHDKTPIGVYAILENKFGSHHFIHEGVLPPLSEAILALDTGYTGEKAKELFRNFGIELEKGGWVLLFLRWE